jgi:transcriptional regulator with XRE-family HTH domain
VQEVRRLRQERGWNQTELAFRSRLAPSVISQIENGKRNPSAGTLKKLAKALEVEVADLFPKAQSPLPLEQSASPGRSLKKIHTEAGCSTTWLVMPEAEWRAAWSPDLSPREAMRIVHEMTAEISALKPLMDKQERGLPWSRRMLSGHFREAWWRYFDGLERAKARGEAAGLIGPEGTPKDLAKMLGQEPVKSLDELMLADSA